MFEDTTGSVLRVCAWCGKAMGPADGRDPFEYPVTHGICETCSHILLDFQELPLHRLIDRIEGPILAVDGTTGRVIAANQKAEAAFGKCDAEMTGMLGGDVMECMHADEPGGCGQTVHCSGCSIRMLVSEVCTNGAGRREIDAYQYVVTPHGIRKKSYLISAEKLEELVLVGIQLQSDGEQTVVD